MPAADFEAQRQQMLAEISATTARVRGLIGKAALDGRVMRAMGTVPRHKFVPIELQPYAYANRPLPIGFDKTISQPFIVALMTDLLEISADNTVLEIGTGLGIKRQSSHSWLGRYTASRLLKSLGNKQRNDCVGNVAPTSSSRSQMAIMAGPSTPRSIE
jgi:protein-L-isoaspartate(D-aspartate) O-methyltransferase